MTEPFATPADLAAIWRPLTDEEEPVVTAWLGIASVLIRDRFRDIDTRVASGLLDPALAGHVAVMMVHRAMTARDPADPVSESESIGEATQARTYTKADAEALGLYMTAAEARLLAPRLAQPRPRTIALGLGIPGP